MNRWITIPLLTASLAGAAQLPGSWTAEATQSYTGPGGSQITLEGACSYDEHHIDCWNANGDADPKLTAKVRSFYTQNPGVQMFYSFRQKNRLVVFSRNSLDNGIQEYQMSGVSEPVFELSREPAGRIYTSSQITAAEDAKFGRTIVGLQTRSEAQAVTVPFFKGSKANYEGAQIEIGDVKPGAPIGYQSGMIPEFGPSGGGSRGPFPRQKSPKQWTIFVQIDPLPAGNLGLNFTPVDKSGKDISFVDLEGNPVAVDRSAVPAPNAHPTSNPPPMFGASTVLATMNGTVAVITCGVNPAKLGALKIDATNELRILFKDIPLEAK